MGGVGRGLRTSSLWGRGGRSLLEAHLGGDGLSGRIGCGLEFGHIPRWFGAADLKMKGRHPGHPVGQLRGRGRVEGRQNDLVVLEGLWVVEGRVLEGGMFSALDPNDFHVAPLGGEGDLMLNELRRATLEDLPEIIKIYNEAIKDGISTADSKIVTVEDKLEWFHAHDALHPILVKEYHGRIIAWISIQPFYANLIINMPSMGTWATHRMTGA